MNSIIKSLKEQTILSAVGCRLNGGGCNRALIVTNLGTYILGGRELYTLTGSKLAQPKYDNGKCKMVGIWNRTALTHDEDLVFAKGIEDTGYEYYSGQGLKVYGLRMKQIEAILVDTTI